MGDSSGVDQVHEPDAVITAEERQEAEQTAELIRRGLEGIEPLVQKAWAGRHWEKLGYPDWAAYIAAEFGADRLPARRALTALLSGEGLSARQIADQTGVPRTTVQRDLGGGVAHSRATGTDQGVCNEPGENVTRPKTGAQRVAEHRSRKREDPHADLRAELAGAGPPPVSAPVTDTGQQETGERPHEHEWRLSCGCGASDPATMETIEGIEAGWREKVRKLEEKAAKQAEFVKALQDEIGRLEAERSERPGSGGRPDPGNGARQPGQAAGVQLDAAGEPMPEDDVFAFLDEEPDYGGSQVPGRRR